MIYLDWAATALPDPQIMEQMAKDAAQYSGNPSSPYPLGKMAKEALENARERCATILNCRPENLAFTSGGSESNSIALLSLLLRREPGTLLYSGVEHPSVADTARMLTHSGWKSIDLPPDTDGRIHPDKLENLLKKHPDTRMVSIMGVNNETGAIQPLKKLCKTVRSMEDGRPIHIHADLVQAAGKTAVDLGDLDVDTASFSAHKFRGPRGVGLFYHRNPKFESFLRGGGQEHGLRPGTENTAGALALTMALEKHGRPDRTLQETSERFISLLNKIENMTMVPAQRREHPEHYVPNIVALSFPPVPGEVLARVLASDGFAVSTGSACSNNKKGKLPKSMVAMNVPAQTAAGMIRISFSSQTPFEDLEKLVAALKLHLPILASAASSGKVGR